MTIFRTREDEVTEEVIATWAAEAEAGYDAEQLTTRGRGRPGRHAYRRPDGLAVVPLGLLGA